MSVRKVRSDCRVGALEKTRGLPAGSLRNPNGRDARSDKKIGTLRNDYKKSKYGGTYMFDAIFKIDEKSFKRLSKTNRSIKKLSKKRSKPLSARQHKKLRKLLNRRASVLSSSTGLKIHSLFD